MIISKLQLCLVVLWSTLLTAPTFGESEYDPPKSFVSADYEPEAEPSKGTGKIAGGSTLIAVGSAVGGITAVIGLMIWNSSCGDDPDDDDDEPSCGAMTRDATGLMLGGGAMIAGSIVGGTLLIRSGKRDRNRWYDWHERQQKSTKMNRPQSNNYVKAVSLSPIVTTKGAGLNISFLIR